MNAIEAIALLPISAEVGEGEGREAGRSEPQQVVLCVLAPLQGHASRVEKRIDVLTSQVRVKLARVVPCPAREGKQVIVQACIVCSKIDQVSKLRHNAERTYDHRDHAFQLSGLELAELYSVLPTASTLASPPRLNYTHTCN